MEKNDENTGAALSVENAKHLQAIEDNPLLPDEIEMFAMFERENWSDDRRRSFILEELRRSGRPTAAE